MTISGVDPAAPRLLLDAREYAQRVLLQGGEVPWEPTAHAQLLVQVGALLRPDLALVDLVAFAAMALDTRPEVRGLFTGARRATAALRSLLADDAFAADAVELVRVVIATSPGPVAVQVASPGAWLAVVATEAHDSEFDADDAENASVYLADWLRRFSEQRIDTLVLDGRGAPFTETLASYDPIRGLCEHYRWRLALRRRDALELSDGRGEILDEAFWSGYETGIPRGASLVLSRVDPAAQPEVVLEARTRWC